MPKVVSNGAQYVKDKVKEIPHDLSNAGGTMKHKAKEMFGSPSPSEFAHNKPKQIPKYVNHGPETTQDTHRVTKNVAGTVNGKEKEILPKTAPHYTFRDATGHAAGPVNGKEKEILPKTTPYTFGDATGHAEPPNSFKHWLGHGNQQQQAKTDSKAAPGHRYMEILPKTMPHYTFGDVTGHAAGTANSKENEILPKTGPHYTFRDATAHAASPVDGLKKEILPKTAPYTFGDGTGHAEPPNSFKHWAKDWLRHGNQQQQAKTDPKAAPGHRYMEITVEDPEPAYIDNMEGHGYMEVMADAPSPYMNLLEGHQYMDATANAPTSYMDNLEGHRYMEITVDSPASYLDQVEIMDP
ncbi:hypothetical protein FRX31_029362 [Thalictrum thalictroides]|uniref:Uncharacterized protein n=1 Tax=Thalictrum thalictroides TaxID=46969 RepID=A0A7J6V8W1_THATH|nr:hypothetical protein FRX31_029362 [Thalictrum thalictroides]